MSRFKFIFVLALLLLVAVPVTVMAQAPEAISAQTPEGTGTAVIFDDQGLSDGIIFTMAGAFTGLAGVLYAMMYGIVPIEAIFWITSGDIVFIVLIGGIGNLYGPLVGAVVLRWLSETLSVVWHRWPLLSGLFLIFVVLFLRGGCVEVLDRLREWLGKLELRRKEASYGIAADREAD